MMMSVEEKKASSHDDQPSCPECGREVGQSWSGCEECAPQRIIVVGDVHGCIFELVELIGECNYRVGVDRLIFVGDLVDKGPRSRAVATLAELCGAEVVLGNHDEKHLRWNRWNRRIAAGEVERNPMKHNGYYWDFTDREWKFFNAMPTWLEVGGWYIVHAGLECTGKTPDEMDDKVMLRIRDVHPETGKYYNTPDPKVRAEGAVRWAEKWAEPKSVIYGHSPAYSVKRDFAPSGDVCLGIDTGCVHGGFLTAVILQHDAVMDIVQVRALKKYSEPFLEEEDYVQLAKPEGS